MDRGPFLSLPNAISMSRLVLAVAFVVVNDARARVGLIGAASLTDFLDGWVARRQHSVSHWGALIDPLADRAFVVTAVCVYLIGGAITTVQYFILISRDLMTAIGFIVARSVPMLRPIAFRARTLGKTVTVLQLITLVAVLAIPNVVRQLVWLVGVASAIAVADYTLALWNQRLRT
jgi:CDP-diacylglycerol--glycerol-3-phosphate 3-phosphatidyltransferase/cardiolipin synthase